MTVRSSDRDHDGWFRALDRSHRRIRELRQIGHAVEDFHLVLVPSRVVDLNLSDEVLRCLYIWRPDSLPTGLVLFDGECTFQPTVVTPRD